MESPRLISFLCACFNLLQKLWWRLSHELIPPCLTSLFPASHSLHSSSLCLLQQTSNVSATLVLSRPIKGPKEVVLDLEMVTVNNVINFRGSSIIRLTIYVSEHAFWAPHMNHVVPDFKHEAAVFTCSWCNGLFETAHWFCFFYRYVIISKDASDKDSDDGKAFLCSNPHPGLVDTELLWLQYGHREIFMV